MTSGAPASGLPPLAGHRAIYDEDHAIFRDTVRRFASDRIAPNEAEWRTHGITPRGIWREAGALGLLCPQVPPAYGGLGLDDYRYRTIMSEEMGSSSLGFGLQTNVTADYILNFGTEAQKESILPGMVSGDTILAIAMTEPGAGSDLRSIRTTARRDGDHLVINGSKTFISSGQLCDLVIVAVRTDASEGGAGMSLVLVEASREGFRRGRNLRKIGRHGADTSELFFEDVRVPAGNLLGEEQRGLAHLMVELPKERLGIALSGLVDATRAYELARDHARERRAFGRAVADFQVNRFALADIRTELEIGWAFVDRCIVQQCEHRLSAEVAAMAKLWVSEMQGRVVDRCLQLFGGYGYMEDYEIGRLYVDARAQRLYGGTSEIMREVISRAL